MDKYENLQIALLKAKGAAQAARTENDGGTCNFDSPTIDYRKMGMSKLKAIKAVEEIGLSAFTWSSYGGSRLVLCGMTAGQGDCRSAMAEAFHKSLKADGIESGMYYQMD